MSVNQISQILNQSLSRFDQTLSFNNDVSFQKTLTIGQVIKGKVLRHFEGSHYSVSFNDQEKVVDSSIPLRTGELIYGRVVGIGDKVKLQRLFIDEQTGEKIQQQADSQKNYEQLNAKERLLEQLFARYQEKLLPQERQVVLKELGRVVNPESMALSSLVLKKMGLSQDPQFLRAVFKQIEGSRNALAKESSAFSVHSAGDAQAGDDAVQTLTAMLVDLAKLDQQLELDVTRPDAQTNSGAGGNGDRGDSNFNEHEMGRWILNSQSDGSVAHWYTTIPIWVNGRIVELNMALFNQNDAFSSGSNNTKYRKIVFSLETDYLGSIQLSVVCANKNLKLEVVADNEYAADYLSRYMKDLKVVLNSEGWIIDEISYGVSDTTLRDGVVKTVVEHHISRDSLNQLM